MISIITQNWTSLWISPPNLAFLHQIHCFWAANVIDLQKGKKNAISEVVARRCSANMLYWKWRKIHRETLFQNTFFIEHLWKTSYFIYKLQNFNHFAQEREGAIGRCSFNQNSWEVSVKKLIRCEIARSQPASLPKKLFHTNSFMNFALIFSERITITSPEEALKLLEHAPFQEI